ncbi:MAG TPA: hypothetical protein VHR45_10785 [Thermoanaerobaculia bacterium]|nr:hypothetical protein [Thermoanaerobaculia bacterium]
MEAGRLFDHVAPGLGDRRYRRIDGRGLLIVRDVARLVDPQAIAGVWRAATPAPADAPGAAYRDATGLTVRRYVRHVRAPDLVARSRAA